MDRRQCFGELAQDIRLGLRQLRRRPVFTVAAVVTLAIGIGATTAIFSAADHVVLRSLPYADADRVVTLWEPSPAEGEMHNEVAPGNFVEWQERAGAFEAMGLAEPSGVDLAGGDGPSVPVPTWSVTEGFFEALGVQPILGGGFRPEHYDAGGPRAVMISHGLWQRRFGGDPALVGRTIDVDGAARTVAGVLPPWLEYPSKKDLWTPKRYRPSEPTDRVSGYMTAVARLRPGVTPTEAQSELDAVAAALGAGRGRLARQLMTESLLLALAGGAAALGLTRFLQRMLYGVQPTDALTFAQTATLLLVVAGLAAFLPARRAARVDPAIALRAD